MDDGSNEWRWCTAAPTSLAFAAVVHSCSDGPGLEVANAGELRLDRSAREFSNHTVKQKVILVNLQLG